MKCLMCNKEFYIRKTFINLFKEEKIYICTTCMQNNQMELEFQEIPLDNHMLRIISGVKFRKYQNNYAYINEMSAIRAKLKSIRQDDYEMIFDNFFLTEEKLSELELLAKMLDKDIILIANTYQL